MLGKGSLQFDNSNSQQKKVTNQVSKQTDQISLPQLLAGSTPLADNNEIVDGLTTQTGSLATIFQLVGDKLLRVATTVKNQQGERAVGTYIPSDSPVFKAIAQGQPYKGKAYVVNDWYLTTYSPLRSAKGEIVGALFVGQLMLAPEVRNFITTTKLNSGYFFAYTEAGDMVVHPTQGKESNLFTQLPVFKEHKKGFIDYTHEGEKKIAYIQPIEKWGLYLAFTISYAGIDNGLTADMIQKNSLVGAGIIGVAILMTFLLVRTINRPLKTLADKSIKVGEGDYTITFEATANDAIGQLAQSLGVMIAKGRVMLEDIKLSAGSLSTASTELASISQQMVANANTTTEIADTAATNAHEVSDNMGSISAAMEQSTTNLDMIASASEEMGATIKEIAENSARARLITEDAVSKAQDSHAVVRELGEAAKAIGVVTETITEISEQTNLLALNATIEAARAGEAGKGFAVVANEIKDLARETANATGQIKEAINRIQQQTGTAVQDIATITSVIQDVNEVVNGIVTAVEEQSITTAEIVNNVHQASQGISEINQNIANSSDKTAQMSGGVAQVKEQSFEVKNNSQYVFTSAEELSQLSEKLNSLVSQFKIS